MKPPMISCLALVTAIFPSLIAVFFIRPAMAQTNQETNANAEASSANSFFTGPQTGGASTIIQPTTVTNSSTILPTGAQNPVGGGDLGYSCPSPSLAIGSNLSGRLADQAPFGSFQAALSIPLGSSADCKKGLASKVRADQINAQILEEGLRQKEFETALKESEWQLKLAAQKLDLFRQCAAVARETGVAIALIPGCDAGLSVATNIPAPPPIERKFVPAPDGLGKSHSTDTPPEEVANPSDALKTKGDPVESSSVKPVKNKPNENDNSDPKEIQSTPPSSVPSNSPTPSQPVQSTGPVPKKPAIDLSAPSPAELNPNNGGIEVTIN